MKKLALLLILNLISQCDIYASKYDGWRSDDKPKMEFNPINLSLEGIPEEYESTVENLCLEEYKKAMKLMEFSVGDVALQYTTRRLSPNPFDDKLRNDDSMKINTRPGAILQFANVYSQRYLDLYEAYIDYEIKQRIPLIPVDAGQMKVHGFRSEEIIKMKKSCALLVDIINDIKKTISRFLFKKKDDMLSAQDKIISAMVGLNEEIKREDFVKDPNKRNRFLSFIPAGANISRVSAELVNEFEKYNALPEKKLIDRAFFLMHDFGHLEFSAIETQLQYVARMNTRETDNSKERLLMEIRHRVAGDMSIDQNSPGTLGGNPVAYLNAIKLGEPGNPKAEFREKMYFVYMSNHLANAVICADTDAKANEKILAINQWLRENNKNWEMDLEFIKYLKSRSANTPIPPIFKYGANAAINKELRKLRSHEDIAIYYQKHPNISIKEAMEGTAEINSYYRNKLSNRELMNQIGEFKWEEKDPNRKDQLLNFGTGAAVFELHQNITQDMTPESKAYIMMINDLHIPVSAGISGTLDQSISMAGLVRLGVDEDEGIKKNELQTMKLAYLAFMLPGKDHSVHEIMQSSKTFGLDYKAGVGYQKYIYPIDQEYILKEIQNEQIKRKSNFPDYYLSESHIKEVYQSVIATPPLN